MAATMLSPQPTKRYPALPLLKISKRGCIKEGAALYSSPQAALHHVKKMMRLDREEFWCIHLDAKNRLVGYEVISVGSLVASIVHPREVFKGLLLNNAAFVIFAHNHPSGDPTPSPEDIEITCRLKNAGELLGVMVRDHIIVGSGKRYYSFSEYGKL